MINKQFQRWDYYAVQELERLCNTLPILPHQKALDFFETVNRAIKSNTKAVERQSGRVFEGLMGVVNASDRKDFLVTCELDSESITNGVLMLETYDRTISVLFCAARVSEHSFLTYAFTGSHKEAIKGLRGSGLTASATTNNHLESNIWATLTRQYLATRDLVLLEQAIAAAREPEIVTLLETFRRGDVRAIEVIAEALQAIDPLVVALYESFQRAGRMEEAIIIALLPLDLRTILAESFNQFPASEQEQVWQIGLEACNEAMQLADRLGDLACIAVYQNVKGNGFYLARRFSEARQAYEEAIEIRRELALSQQEFYGPLALALNNLATVLTEMREFESARKTYEEALLALRHLVKRDPQKYEPDLAMVLGNLGVVLSHLQELAIARKHFEGALEIRRRLAQLQPLRYDADLAKVLHNLGTLLSNLQEFEPARKCCEEALDIYRRLADDQQSVYEPELAETLSNLGVILHDLNELPLSRQRHEEALLIFRRLANHRPLKYQPSLANSLNNLGNTLRTLGERDTARAQYVEAIALRDQNGLYLESAGAYYNLGFLEEENGNAEQSLIFFEACVERCEHGLSQLAEREHRDLFKSRIEPAYLRLIQHYAYLAENNQQMMQEKLVGLLESLRQIETLAEFGEAATNEVNQGRLAFRRLISSTGELSTLFREQRCAFLWIHAARSKVIFVTLVPGRCEVQMTERALIEKFRELFGKVENMVFAHIPRAGEAVFDLLPDQVKKMLTGGDYKTVFLAPCSETINLPFEMVRIPNRHSPHSHVEDSYLGLRLLMPRVHGLAELVQVLKRQPDLTGVRKALVVGNPLHHGFPHTNQPCEVCGRAECCICADERHCGWQRLDSARMMADELANILLRNRYALIPNGGPLLDESATLEELLLALADNRLALWAQMGHGGRPTAKGAESTEYLALAGTNRMMPQQLAHLQLESTVVHLDCCVTGTTRWKGGGRFVGHPTAMLLAGASCVLSSVHALFDDAAAEFSARLYSKTLREQNPMPLGDALLQTQREMAIKYHDNPIVWATTVFWGNPWVQLT